MEVACLAAFMLHLVRQRFQEGALSCTRRPQQQGHATGLDGSADVVQDDKSGLAWPDANETNEPLHNQALPLTIWGTSGVLLCFKGTCSELWYDWG